MAGTLFVSTDRQSLVIQAVIVFEAFEYPWQQKSKANEFQNFKDAFTHPIYSLACKKVLLDLNQSAGPKFGGYTTLQKVRMRRRTFRIYGHPTI